MSDHPPIVLSKILCSGGACPYQIEAETSDGKWFYLRYRWGRLRYGVWDTMNHFDHSSYLYSEQLDPEGWDGVCDPEMFAAKLAGRVIFPEGFQF